MFYEKQTDRQTSRQVLYAATRVVELAYAGVLIQITGRLAQQSSFS